MFYGSLLISLSQFELLSNFDRDRLLLDRVPSLLWLCFKLDPLVTLLAFATITGIVAMKMFWFCLDSASTSYIALSVTLLAGWNNLPLSTKRPTHRLIAWRKLSEVDLNSFQNALYL